MVCTSQCSVEQAMTCFFDLFQVFIDSHIDKKTHSTHKNKASSQKKKNLSIFLVYTKSKGHLSRISTRVFVYSQPSFHENKLIEHRPTAMHEVLSHVLCIIRLICTSRNNCTMFFFENTF